MDNSCGALVIENGVMNADVRAPPDGRARPASSVPWFDGRLTSASQAWRLPLTTAAEPA